MKFEEENPEKICYDFRSLWWADWHHMSELEVKVNGCVLRPTFYLFFFFFFYIMRITKKSLGQCTGVWMSLVSLYKQYTQLSHRWGRRHVIYLRNRNVTIWETLELKEHPEASARELKLGYKQVHLASAVNDGFWSLTLFRPQGVTDWQWCKHSHQTETLFQWKWKSNDQRNLLSQGECSHLVSETNWGHK